MKSFTLRIKETREYLLWVFLVGVALGIANYALGIWPNIWASLILQVTISMIIGLGLLLVVFNARYWLPSNISPAKRYAILVLLFALIGFIGSEVQGLVQYLIGYGGSDFNLFSGGGTYIFNMILTCIIGFTIYNWVQHTSIDQKEEALEEINTNVSTDPPTSIPVRQGQTTTLHQLDQVLYFAAYDNYAFLYNASGQKLLCNYSLLQLEQKLAPKFIRVHRKYLINKSQIYQIQPHLKGRFSITFKDKKRSSITSSNSYNEVVKNLLQL